MKVMKFYSPCCGQCRVVAREFKDNPINVPIEDINVVEEPEIADKYNVKGLPTILLLNAKEECDKYLDNINKEEEKENDNESK